MATKKEQGVVLFAFGKHTYYWAMYNLLFSIKQHSPNVKVACFVGDKNEMGRFCPDIFNLADLIEEIETDHLYTNGKFDPGKLKVNIYNYLPYHYNLYLDVDAVCLKDIEPLFTELKYTNKQYCSHTVGYHRIENGRKIESMQWAFADDIWETYGLKKDSVLPAINSSLQFIEKGEDSKKIYDTAKDLYENKPLPLEKLRMKWGNGQPDELYMNITFALLNYDPACTEIGYDGAEKGHIHFAMNRTLDYLQVVDRYYFQSYYGGKGFTARYYTEWLDRLLTKMQRALGAGHQYTIDRILNYKYADNKK